MFKESNKIQMSSAMIEDFLVEDEYERTSFILARKAFKDNNATSKRFKGGAKEILFNKSHIQ